MTWLVSWWHYRRAGSELREEAVTLRSESARVRRMINTLGEGLERKGWIEITRDAQGEIEGVRVHGSAAVSAGVTGMAEGAATRYGSAWGAAVVSARSEGVALHGPSETDPTTTKTIRSRSKKPDSRPGR